MAADKRKGVIAPPLQSLSLGQEHAKEARRANDKRNSNGDDSLTRGPRQSITMVTRGGCAKKERERKNGVFHGRLRDDLHRCLGNKRSNEARDHRTTFLASFSSPLSSLPSSRP